MWGLVLGSRQESDGTGEDVRLEAGASMEWAQQHVPYAATALHWSCVQAYVCGHRQHIDVLERMAFFNCLRFLARNRREHSARFSTF